MGRGSVALRDGEFRTMPAVAGDNRFYHTPVMVKEILDALAVRPGGHYVDCTVGEGGHALRVLSESSPDGQLLGLDLDSQALDKAYGRLTSFDVRNVLVQGNYKNLESVLGIQEFFPVDGILFDLGLSSLQLEGENRGFSFLRSEPLDMRFDPLQDLTAAQVVNTFPRDQLADLIWRYGEEPKANAIARTLCQYRPIQNSAHLAGVIAKLIGHRRTRIHPATRTFQALRMYVNGELANLELGLKQAIQALISGGRLAVISYHSLEDRIAKTILRRESQDCVCPPRMPACLCGHVATMKLITRKVVRPSLSELALNPRSRSAKLRIAEKI